MIQKKGMWCTATSIFNRSINSMLQGALEELRSVRDYLIDNYYTKQEVDAKDATHYTKDEADDTFVKKEELNNYPTNDEVKDLFKNYYTKSEIDKLLKNYNPNPNPGGETMTEQDVQTLIDNSLSNYVTNTQFSELSSTVTNNQSAMADIQRWQVEQMIPFVQQQALVKQDFFYIAGSKGDAKIPFSTITNKITNDGSIGQGNHDVVLVEKSVTTLPNFYNKTESDNKYMPINADGGWLTEDNIGDILVNYVTTDWEFLINDTGIADDHKDCDFNGLSDYVLVDIRALSNFYNKSEIDTKLANISTGGSVDLDGYLKKTDAANTYATKTSLDNYTSKTSLTDTLKSYVTNTAMSSYLSGYVTTTALSNILDSKGYVTNSALTNYLTKTAAQNTYATFSNLTDFGTNFYTKTEIDNKLKNLNTGSTSVDLSNYYTKTDCDNNFITSDTAFCYVDGDGKISGDALLNSIDEYTLASKDYVDNQIIEATIDETTLNTKINDIVTSKNLVTTTTLNSYYTSTQVDSKVTDLGVKIDNINSKIANVTTASVINLSVEAVTSNNYMVVKNNSDPDNVVSISSPDITIVPKPNNSVVYTINGTKLSDTSSFIYINPNAAYKTAGTFTLIVNLADTSTAVISLNIWSDATNVVYYNNSIYSKDNSLYTFKKGFSTIVTMDVLTNQITIKELPILAQVQDVNKITEQQLVDLLKNTPDNCIRLVGNNNQSDLNLQKNNISDSSCTITSKLSSSGIWYTDVQFSDSNYILKEGAFATKVKTALGVGNIVDTFAPYDNSYVFFSLITKVLLFKVTNCTGAELGCHLLEPDAACKIYLPNTSDNTFSDDFIGSINSNINNITTANIILY